MQRSIAILAALALMAVLPVPAGAAETRLYLSNSPLPQEDDYYTVFDTADPEWGAERFVYGDGIVRNGVRYEYFSDELFDDLRPIGFQKLIGHIMRDGKRYGDVYTLLHDEDNEMLAVLYADNEWMFYYCRADMEPPEITLARCERMEYKLWGGESEWKLLQPQSMGKFIDAIEKYSETDARKRYGADADRVGVPFGYLYGYVAGCNYLRLEYHLSPYNENGFLLEGQDVKWILDKTLLQ